MNTVTRTVLTAAAATIVATASQAGTFFEAGFGDTRFARSLLRYDSVYDVQGLVRLARVQPGFAADGLAFPDGGPVGQPLGEIQFNRGLPVYFTAVSRFRSGLYRWSSNSPNIFNTADLFGSSAGPGLRSVNVFGYQAPTCVGIRGNGPRLWAHFSSIARIVEEFGWCTNWDAPDTLDIAGLAAEGWSAPLETGDAELLDYVNAGTGLGLPGCTPGVP